MQAPCFPLQYLRLLTFLAKSRNMTKAPEILCVGSVLWDIIGRSASHMRAGSDVPGRIIRLPGGVAMNIAMALSRFGLKPALLSAIGQDPEGNELVAECARRGLGTDHLYRSADLPTDRYMAIEGANGLIAAIADAHSLEAAGDKILNVLNFGPLGRPENPFDGLIALDGNLTAGLLEQIATSPSFSKADLRVAPASPGKAERLLPFLRSGRGTLYVNLEEAGLLCQSSFETADQAASQLLERGAARVLVTNGGDGCCDATADGLIQECPPPVLVTRVTGAGDTFMAAHIAAECDGANRKDALSRALHAAAAYVSGEVAI
ncbi:sugar/nucleoside kinase (ribokinase family) [Pelagimonas varians]|uniref:Pseudouridine kinase n=2 Tax=Pelagimonas varians TaxID=696760 RepID=A0A238JQL1_9RHOB|nr:sugar/nucleoside kinase (ribokinase family) [Pelagimonas varians]SMX32484.1 Pseudouridine kinase [Pelagimonas varians]